MEEEPETRVIVGIPPRTTDQELRDACKCLNPQSVRALPGKPYGMLHFATAAEAQAAVAELGKGKVRIEFNT
jgi:hypothetical protein